MTFVPFVKRKTAVSRVFLRHLIERFPHVDFWFSQAEINA